MDSNAPQPNVSIEQTSNLSIRLRLSDTPTTTREPPQTSSSSTMGDATESSSSSKPLKIMIVGDSISHGAEGDYTWRYRIWEWFRSAAPSQDVTFVGPYTGTVQPPDPKPPQPPRFPDEPEPSEPELIFGGYNKSVSSCFESAHFAYTGRQAKQVKDLIHTQVAAQKPDLLLILLGFNDLGWCVSDPVGLLGNILELVANARLANPSVSIALSNVPQRSPLPGHPALSDWTDKYNAMLARAVLADHRNKYTSKTSRIELVDVAKSYGWVPDECAGTCDGLHPNELGEYQIAAAFSTTLHKSFGFGEHPLSVPEVIPSRPIHTPKNPKAYGVPYGIHFEFSPVYGTRGYEIRQRLQGQEDWHEYWHPSNIVDNTFTSAGAKWEFQARAKSGDKEEDKTSWTEIVRGTAEKHTAPPPGDRQAWTVKDGIELTWTPIDEKKLGFEVDRYVVYWKDETVGGFLCGQGARGSRSFVKGLENGHRFSVWVQTWTVKEGPGDMGGIPGGVVVAGSGVFSRPEGLEGELRNLQLNGRGL